MVADVTEHRLGLLGMGVTRVTNEAAMSESISVSLPDAVIVDLDLDQGAGLRWIETIAADECTAHIPVLCISSRGDLVEVEQAFKAGAVGLLVSPFDPIDLENKLIQAMRNAEFAVAIGDSTR